MNILKQLQNRTEVSRYNITENTSSNSLKGHSCSDTSFNLSHRVLSDAETKTLEKGLGFGPIQRKINEPERFKELRKDFEEFCRRMRTKWHFRNGTTSDFSNVTAFALKFAWKPPEDHLNLEVFLSQVEPDLFKAIERQLGYSNFFGIETTILRKQKSNLAIKMLIRMLSLKTKFLYIYIYKFQTLQLYNVLFLV